MIMKKNVLALSVAAALGGGVVGSANAVLYVESAGLGHALITPYFSTQEGNATLINIVNTDKVYGKAVKVRFRSAVDSDDIFDFQIFMSPGDVWTGMVTANANGTSTMTTSDKSCTLPESVNQDFVTSRLQDYTSAGGTTFSPADQTREGYIEIFNMGDIQKYLPTSAVFATPAWPVDGPVVSDAATGARTDFSPSTTVNPLYTATKHVNGLAPCTSDVLLGIEAVGGVVTAPAVAGATTTLGGPQYTSTQQLIAATGGLMGNWTIINVPKTLTFTGDMTAIRAYNETTTATTSATQTMVVYSGQTGNPRSATHAASANALSFPALRLTEDGVLLNSLQTGAVTADYDFPDMSTPYEATDGVDVTPYYQAAELSNAISRGTVINEFITSASIGAGTDWVLSLPTRRYHVAGRGINYGASGDSNGYPCTGVGCPNNGYLAGDGTDDADDALLEGGVTPPFVATAVTFATNGRSACINTGSAPGYTNREEVGAAGGGAVISPGVPSKYSICGEVNVLSWNNSGSTSSVLSGKLTSSNASSGTTTEGWGTATLGGLPVLGSAFVKAYNGLAAEGVSGNYGGTYTHRYK